MRFLNKDFFKFTFGFLVIVSLSLLIIAAVSAYAAGVEKIAFTTEPQTVKQGEISGAITIQTQDSNGTSLQTPETIDLEFTSTSATGEFLSSTGSPVGKTMSKNTANRTFYYRDQTIGTHTLTVVAKGRESQAQWSANQQITISNEAGIVASSEAAANSSESLLSAMAGPADPHYGTVASTLEVVAGRDRLTAPGSPVTFQAYVKKNSNSNSSLQFDWSFGDGNVGRGPIVTHTYKYPGGYVVVLNAKSGNNYASSRLKVRVAEPLLTVASHGEYVEIANNGNNEVNLFNWKIEDAGRSFIFQPDTIILPKSSIKLEKSLLTMNWAKDSKTAIRDSLDREIARSPQTFDLDLGKIALELEAIKNQALIIKNKAIAVNESDVGEVGIDDQKPESQTASAVLYEAPKKESSLIGLTKFIKSIFSD